MDVISLPEYLTTNSSPIQVIDYQNLKNHSKSKIDLKKNTFSFLQEGTKEVYHQQQKISIQNSEFLLIKSGHCLMTENLSSSNQLYRSILLFFSDEVVLNFYRKHKIQTKPNRTNQSVEVCNYDAFITHFVKSLIEITTLDLKTQHQLLPIKFEEIMIYLMERNGTDMFQFIYPNSNIQNRNLIHVVENNLYNKLTLKELAFLSNMSVSTFKREFEKQYDASPIKWFQGKRLEYSAFLLKEKAMRPSEIFEEIGYENLSNFNMAFKTKFGVTPKQYQHTH